MKKLFYLMLALPLVFAACNENPEEVKPTPEPEPTEGVVVEAKSFTGNYDYEEGDEAGIYAVVLSENGYDDEGNMKVNSSYYALIIYGEIAEGEIGSTVTLPAGEYTLDKTGAVGTISPYTSFLCKTHDDPNSIEDDEVEQFDEVALVVTAEGLTLTAMIDGVKHTVTYTGSLEVNDLREVESPEGVTFEAQMLDGQYDYCEGDEAGNYYIVLSDNGLDIGSDNGLKTDSTYYFVDLYGVVFESESNGYVTLPAGEYLLDTEETYAVGTIDAMNSYFMNTATGNSVYAEYESATLVATAEGLTLTAVINGVEHTVTYAGSLELMDIREPEE